MEHTRAARRLILSLCDASGNWCRPYRSAEYEVIQVDLSLGNDVTTYIPPRRPHGVMAAPPCTVWTNAGARHWKTRTPAEVLMAWRVLQACRRLCELATAWWCIENPRGRLSRLIGPHAWEFQPWHYGDAYTKRTCLWGNFTPPATSPVIPTARMVACSTKGRQKRPTLFGNERMPEIRPLIYGDNAVTQVERQARSSDTPAGFAQAFRAANP